MTMRRRAEIFLIRHGETQWNVEGRFQGRLDSPLTERGRHQALRIGDRLRDLLGARRVTINVSPLGRARETAALLTARLPSAAEPVLDDRLSEVTLGSWDGLTMIDIDAMWPGRLDGSGPFDWYFRAPDGEPFEAVRARAEAWLADVPDTAEAIVAISHGLTGRVIRGVFAGIDRQAMLELPVRQDALWHLHGDGITEIPL